MRVVDMASAPVPRHRHHVVESVALVIRVRCEANATAVRQVDDKHLLAGRVARRHHELQGAVVEQVEVALRELPTRPISHLGNRTDFVQTKLNQVAGAKLAVDCQVKECKVPPFT